MKRRIFNLFLLSMVIISAATYSYPLGKQLIGARHPALSPG